MSHLVSSRSFGSERSCFTFSNRGSGGTEPEEQGTYKIAEKLMIRKENARRFSKSAPFSLSAFCDLHQSSSERVEWLTPVVVGSEVEADAVRPCDNAGTDPVELPLPSSSSVAVELSVSFAA